jgi:hypothetical protein
VFAELVDVKNDIRAGRRYCSHAPVSHPQLNNSLGPEGGESTIGCDDNIVVLIDFPSMSRTHFLQCRRFVEAML